MSEFCEFSSSLLGEKYYKAVHESGLEIYVFPKNMSTTYGILSVNFGGCVTEYWVGEKKKSIPLGCAHFLEHKIFDNPDGTNADDIFSSYGAYCNAYTSSTRTAYLFSTTSNEEECLEQLLYFVTNPYFTKESVDKEIGIIAQEIIGCIDDPDDRSYMGLLDGMYYNNPVKNEICGSVETISQITPEILYECCQDFYIPSNMVLSVCGRIEPKNVLEIVTNILANKTHKLPERIAFKEPECVKNAYIKKEMDVGKSIFTIGIKDVNIPKSAAQRFRRSEAINILLNVMFSEAGDFYLEMLENGLISPGLDSGYSSTPDTAYIMISGESDDPETVFARIKEHIAECIEKGFCERDFQREKKCLYASYISDFDLTEDIAFMLNSYAWDGLDVFSYPDLVGSIRFEELSDLAKEIFKEDYFTLSVIDPQRRE